MEVMQLHGWPVSASIGVVTCLGTSDSVDGILRAADEMMYSIKANGKNGIGFTVRTGKDVEMAAAA
jgi:PleD family two-component response regulator